ncbi:MAG: ATP-binding cassette domain-containing protein [Saprospiraceae bacterium]|nr:ATP-binding cassette domain-containing protein [Saprospiraceae bacterium]
MSINVKNISKIYGAQKAIDNISFNAEVGEIIGLIGPNGAGKTTTMKILTGYIPQTAGTVEVFGHDLQDEELQIKKLTGYLPEHNPLYGSMYVKEYLTFVCRVHKLSNIKDRIERIIERVGLTDEQHKKISSLSKGYKQRVGIAQAIIHDPKVLILDEPISGLDPNQLIEIRSLIKSLSEGRIIIFSSHILQEIESICDKVIILDKGKIIKDDSLVDLNAASQNIINLKLTCVEAINYKSLREITGVLKIEKSNAVQCILRYDINDDPRPAIFDWAVQQNNKILEMTPLQESLETIFKSVTQS